MLQICFFPKIVAFLCGLSVFVILTISVASSTWLTSNDFQQGVFYYCVSAHQEKPLPPGIPDQLGCFASPIKLFILVSGVLLAGALALDLLATILIAVTLCSKSISQKTSCFKAARVLFISAFLFCFAGLATFAVMFSLEFRQWGRESFEFGWAFGMGWGAAIFLFGAVLLLCCDRGTDTVYYAAKTMDFA